METLFLLTMNFLDEIQEYENVCFLFVCVCFPALALTKVPSQEINQMSNNRMEIKL